MNLKQWIVTNLDADKIHVWLAANSAKFLIEISISALLSLLIFACGYGVIWLTERSFPFGAAGPVGFYLIIVAGTYKEYWNCRLR